MGRAFAGLGLLLSVAGAAWASEKDFLGTLEKGMQEAERSRQAILYVTKWKEGV
ncbi:MAG: hypothetical protein ACYS47_18520 [Planctomycetota bacterium]|jgi:hypothetical protein